MKKHDSGKEHCGLVLYLLLKLDLCLPGEMIIFVKQISWSPTADSALLQQVPRA